MFNEKSYLIQSSVTFGLLETVALELVYDLKLYNCFILPYESEYILPNDLARTTTFKFSDGSNTLLSVGQFQVDV